MPTILDSERRTSEDGPAAQDAPSHGRWRKRGLVATGVVAVIAAAAAFIPGAASRDDSGPKLTHTVSRGDLVVSVTEQGTLESSNNTEIKCKVRGYNTVIWAIEGGTEVKAGDVLVRLDTKRIEDAVSLQTAQKMLEQSEELFKRGYVTAKTRCCCSCPIFRRCQ